MKPLSLISSALIGAVASARSMTPMATLATARMAGLRAPGWLTLLDHPVFRVAALALGAGELLGDKLKSAPDRTAPLGLLARATSAGIAGAAVARRGEERAGAAVAALMSVPLAYLTLWARKRAIARFGPTRSALMEDALAVAAGLAIVFLAFRRGGGTASSPAT